MVHGLKITLMVAKLRFTVGLMDRAIQTMEQHIQAPNPMVAELL